LEGLEGLGSVELEDVV